MRCEIKGKDGRNVSGERKGDTAGCGVDRLMDSIAWPQTDTEQKRRSTPKPTGTQALKKEKKNAFTHATLKSNHVTWSRTPTGCEIETT